jgi:hypothetical protein
MRTFKKIDWLFGTSLIIFITTIILIVLRLLDVWEIFLPNIPDNARYFLSAVAQTLASLFALVITLSLIIMQLLTQTYTSAIFEIYVKRPRVLLFFATSGFIIIFSLYVLLQIQNKQVCHFECMKTDIVLVLVAFSVVWTIIYFFDLLSIVKPYNFLKIIEEKLSRTTSKKEIISIIGDICDISMKKSDISTSNGCISIFERSLYNLTTEERSHLSDILRRLFENAIINDSNEMISAIIGISFYEPIREYWTR